MYKYSKLIKFGLINVPIFLSLVMYFLFVYNFSTVVVGTIQSILLILEFIVLFIINNESTFEYKYVSFYFNDDSMINTVKTEQVKYKGKWIIIKNNSMNSEVRFRIEDVKKVEYYNENNIIPIILN